MQLIPSLVLCVLLISTPAYAYRAKVVGVADGDSLTVLVKGREKEIRLYGIDAPEKKQAFGQKAKGEITALCAGKSVDIEEIDQDSYGRAVVWVMVNGRSVNEMMVASGYAWVYRAYCRDQQRCARLLQLEHSAREAKRGLWRYRDPLPPWEWRHQRD
jgi:micrococcal nuclease